MKRIALAAGLAACLGLFAAPSVRADATIIRHDPKGGKDVILSGVIQSETPAGVKVKVGKDSQLIPPDQIAHISYDLKAVGSIEFDTPYAKEQDALALTGEGARPSWPRCCRSTRSWRRRSRNRRPPSVTSPTGWRW